MEFPTVNKFLFCCGLRAGGFVLGWISAIFSGLAVVILGIFMIISLVGIGTISSYEGEGKPLILSAFLLAIVVQVLTILVPSLVLYASINLIRGTSNRNHVQMRPYLIMMIVELVLWLINSCSNRGPVRISVVLSIIVGIIQIYLLICIYSLYEKTKKASFNAGTANNQPPANLYPAQSVVIYSTQPTNNDGGMIYDQKEANRPAPMYSNQPPSYPGFVDNLNTDHSVIVVTSGKE